MHINILKVYLSIYKDIKGCVSMAKKILISFKEDVLEEVLLYDLLMKKSCKSVFIKETLIKQLGIDKSFKFDIPKDLLIVERVDNEF
jgi:hypothetical protein